MNIRNAFAMLALAAAPAASVEAQVWGTAVGAPHLTGSRTGAPLTTSASWSTYIASWTIIQVGNNWSYSYSFFSTTPAISHVILGLTDTCTSFSTSASPTSAQCIWNLQYSGSGTAIGTYTSSPGNPGFPSGESFWGIKFDNTVPSNGTLNVTFMSDRAPVWGDFYAKGGNGDYAFNDGLLDGYRETSNDINMFVARPNGNLSITSVPEPSTYVLMAAGLAGLGFAARRRRKV